MAFLYISAAGKQVSGSYMGQNDNIQSIGIKLYCGHARRKQVPHVVDGVWCIPPQLNAHIIKTVAFLYISAAGKQVTGSYTGQNNKKSVHWDQIVLGPCTEGAGSSSG